MKNICNIIILVSLFTLQATAADHDQNPTIEMQKITSHIQGVEGFPAVREFTAIRKLARNLGLRVWIYGGTTASFAHYVLHDLKLNSVDDQVGRAAIANGAIRELEIRDFMNDIQDIDLVVEGNREVVKEFIKRLQRKFRYYHEGRPRWDVGLLHEHLGPRDPILQNEEVMNQHNDSLSMGLIELTDPPAGVDRFMDVKNPNGDRHRFLRDISERKITFYFSEKHATTSRALEGKNPAIMSVIRFLTKAHRYNLSVSPEDYERLKLLVDEFDPKAEHPQYVFNWLKYNMKKMVMYSQDRTKLLQDLENLGVKTKLLSIREQLNEDIVSFLTTTACVQMLKRPNLSLERGAFVTGISL